MEDELTTNNHLPQERIDSEGDTRRTAPTYMPPFTPGEREPTLEPRVSTPTPEPRGVQAQFRYVINVEQYVTYIMGVGYVIICDSVKLILVVAQDRVNFWKKYEPKVGGALFCTHKSTQQ